MSAPRVELLLIRNDPPCRKCHKTEDVLREIADADPEHVSVRIITTGTAEAAEYGTVLTPMTLLNGKILCAGMVPQKHGVERLVAAELEADG